MKTTCRHSLCASRGNPPQSTFRRTFTRPPQTRSSRRSARPTGMQGRTRRRHSLTFVRRTVCCSWHHPTSLTRRLYCSAVRLRRAQGGRRDCARKCWSGNAGIKRRQGPPARRLCVVARGRGQQQRNAYGRPRLLQGQGVAPPRVVRAAARVADRRAHSHCSGSQRSHVAKYHRRRRPRKVLIALHWLFLHMIDAFV